MSIRILGTGFYLPSRIHIVLIITRKHPVGCGQPACQPYVLLNEQVGGGQAGGGDETLYHSFSEFMFRVILRSSNF